MGNGKDGRYRSDMMESSSEFDVMRWKWSGWQIAPVTKEESKRELTWRGEEEEERSTWGFSRLHRHWRSWKCADHCALSLIHFVSLPRSELSLYLSLSCCSAILSGWVMLAWGWDSQYLAIRNSQVLQKERKFSLIENLFHIFSALILCELKTK